MARCTASARRASRFSAACSASSPSSPCRMFGIGALLQASLELAHGPEVARRRLPRLAGHPGVALAARGRRDHAARRIPGQAGRCFGRAPCRRSRIRRASFSSPRFCRSSSTRTGACVAQFVVMAGTFAVIESGHRASDRRHGRPHRSLAAPGRPAFQPGVRRRVRRDRPRTAAAQLTRCRALRGPRHRDHHIMRRPAR